MTTKFFQSMESQQDLLKQIDDWLATYEDKPIEPDIIDISYLPFAYQTQLAPGKIGMTFTASIIFSIVSKRRYQDATE